MNKAKRIFDLCLVIGSSPAWVAVCIVVSVLVALKMGRPILFRQRRAGQAGEAFQLIKFRTMTSEIDENGQLLPDEARLTRFGKWLRATSLDEFPEFINVLRGQMSLVGPRPLHLSYNNRYTAEQRRRLSVAPGLTGWAQIKGRNNVSWNERFVLDVWYVDNQSLLLDLKILFLTVFKVLNRDGIRSDTSETMEEFMGTEK